MKIFATGDEKPFKIITPFRDGTSSSQFKAYGPYGRKVDAPAVTTNHIIKMDISNDGRYWLFYYAAGDTRAGELWDIERARCLHAFAIGEVGYLETITPQNNNFAFFKRGFDATAKGRIMLAPVEKAFYTYGVETLDKHVFAEKPHMAWKHNQNTLYDGPEESHTAVSAWDLNCDGSRMLIGVSRTIFAGSAPSEQLSKNLLALLDTSTGEVLREFGEFTTSVTNVCFCPDERLVLSKSRDEGVCCWNIATGTCLATYAGNLNGSDLYFPPGADHAAVGDGNILQFDYDYEFPGWISWDDDAASYVQKFLALNPAYTDSDFDRLLTELQRCGFGYVRPGGIRTKLDELQFGW